MLRVRWSVAVVIWVQMLYKFPRETIMGSLLKKNKHFKESSEAAKVLRVRWLLLGLSVIDFNI